MKYIVGSIFVVCAIALLFVARTGENGGQFGGSMDINYVEGSITPRTAVVYTTSTVVAATSTGRIYLRVQNSSSTVIDCTFGATAIAGRGIRLMNSTSSNAVFELGQNTGFVIPSSLNCVSNTLSGGVVFVDVTGR